MENAWYSRFKKLSLKFVANFFLYKFFLNLILLVSSDILNDNVNKKTTVLK